MTAWTPKPGLRFGCSRIGDQAPALAALAALAQRHPGLPSAYLVTSYVTPDTVSVQVDTPDEVTVWRDVLAPDVPVLRGNDGRAHADFTADGIAWQVYAARPSTRGEGSC